MPRVRLVICVRYPMSEGDALVLRTSRNWDLDVTPATVTPVSATFELDLDEAFVAVKPCLRRADGHHWSVGDNYVLSAHDPDP